MNVNLMSRLLSILVILIQEFIIPMIGKMMIEMRGWRPSLPRCQKKVTICWLVN